ncbi:MAG: hypothetical protein ABIQ58_02530 [Candidatus Limnocylindrales bacterium]
MTSVIHTERLTSAHGPHRGIIHLDLDVESGEILGYLGPDGAGQTTMLGAWDPAVPALDR